MHPIPSVTGVWPSHWKNAQSSSGVRPLQQVVWGAYTRARLMGRSTRCAERRIAQIAESNRGIAEQSGS